MNAIVLTSINPPNRAIRELRDARPDWRVVVVGDAKTPEPWDLDGVRFLSLAEQLKMDFELARAVPQNHYARKNVGYLWAIGEGSAAIAETDDDNFPHPNFLDSVSPMVQGRRPLVEGWVNVYTYFTDARIWPRGLPLEVVRPSLDRRPPLGDLIDYFCPIQQFLIDGDSDVDSVYRLVMGGDVTFTGSPVVLTGETLCPFNSQNTLWWREAFPCLYLPSHVTFRMTDIWRSFIAHRCATAVGWAVAFHASTVSQDRNEHSLIADFEEEIPGFLHNNAITSRLRSLDLSDDPAHMGRNVRDCYGALVAGGFVPEAELRLLDIWLEDLARMK